MANDEFPGYTEGVGRVLESGLLPDVDADAEALVRPALDVAGDLLRRSDASERFSRLFGELVTVAALARYANAEKPLTDDQIEEFFDSTRGFTNSWFGWFCRDEDR